MTATNPFDSAAAEWDRADCRTVLARDVAQAIRQAVDLSPDLACLDYGCGTGLVSLALASAVGSMTGADTSTGMLEVLRAKAEGKGIPIRLLHLKDAHGGDLGGSFDLIFSSMTLHHVEDVPLLLKGFFRHLNPGGRVALADLEEEDGSFHEGDSEIFHQGFAREQIRIWLLDAGFEAIQIGEAAIVEKNGRQYKVFLATAKRGG